MMLKELMDFISVIPEIFIDHVKIQKLFRKKKQLL